MTEAYHPTMAQRVQLFKDYYARQNTRPLLGFFHGSEYPLFRYEAAKSLTQHRHLTPDDFKVEPYLEDCDRLFESHEACGGDFIFSPPAFWGIPWVEAALGCPLYANQSTGSIHAETPESFSGPDSIPAFDPGSPWMLKMVEFLDAMAAHADGRYPLSTTRMRGIADLLSALYGGEKFLFAMMSDAEVIHQTADKLADLWIGMGRLQLEHIPEFHGGTGSFYYSMWAPAGTVWHQEDAAALLSPNLYKEFIQPCDQRIVEAFGGCIMHMHPGGYLPYREYLGMNFLALELHVDEGGPRARDLFDIHQEILQRKPLLIWGGLQEEDMDWIFSQLPPQGLAVNTVVQSAEQARQLYQKYIR